MVVTCGAPEPRGSTAGRGTIPPAVAIRSGRDGIRLRKAQVNPPGLWARVLVRALVVAAAGVMALGFLGPGEAVLVAGLTSLTFVLLWLRERTTAPPEE